MLKQFGLFLGMIAALPGVVCCRLTGHIGTFRSFAEVYSLVPGLAGKLSRAGFYHLTLAKCPLNINIGIYSKINYPETEVGDGVMIGAYCSIGLVTFGDHSGCAERTSILSGQSQHNFQDTSRLVLSESNPPTRVHIGFDTHIGAGCIILANVGKKCLVGPGSVVVNEVLDGTIVVGNPARLVKKRELA